MKINKKLNCKDRDIKKNNYWYIFIKWILRIFFAVPLYIDYSREHKVDNKPKIFVANHLSTLDPLMLMIVLPEQVSILITGGVFSIPFVGKLLAKAGHIPVYENQGRAAYNAAKEKLLRGESVLIFPEGQLSSENGSIKKLFSGALRLSIETNIPIVSVGISMTKNRWIKQKMYLGGKLEHARFYLIGKYAVTVGSPKMFANYMHKANHINTITKYLLDLAAKSASRISENAYLGA
ncbi:MAG: lysophospholipid acyltransferase family protein [Candidatus Roizmanbacteria bacterium]|nr:lysophospholipid acyltransferase family protein [Candidatus Roizmanbacteria bacterium]